MWLVLKSESIYFGLYLVVSQHLLVILLCLLQLSLNRTICLLHLLLRR
jgi:hypothetical protein